MEYAALGHYDPDGFWSLTPRQLNERLKASNKRLVREHNERMTAAYYTAVIPMMKKLPKLEKLLIREVKAVRRSQSWQEQLAIARQWTAASRR